MNKDELVTSIAQAFKSDGMTKKQINKMLEVIFQEIGKSIKRSNRFKYPSFGTFTVRNRKARTGHNPRTGETMKIRASKSVGFKPSPKLKNSL